MTQEKKLDGTQISPKVYVANYAGHDYENAKQYGELVYLTKGYVSFKGLDRLRYILAEKIKDTDKDDYLLLSGAGSICVFIALSWLVKHGAVKLLIWDQHKDTKSYRTCRVTVDNTEELNHVVSSVEGIDDEDSY